MSSYDLNTGKAGTDARTLVLTLREHDVPPDDEYTAEAGQDYGYVAAWTLSDGNTAIAYGNNGQTDYTITDDADDLAAWLESPDLDTLDTAIQTANVRGIAAVDTTEDADLDAYVLITRDWYGATETTDAARDDNGEPRVFASAAEAQDWIDEIDDGIYTTAHNEIGRPTYTIIHA